MNTKRFAIVLVLVVVLSSFAGLVSAQDPTPAPPTPGRFGRGQLFGAVLDVVAQQTGLTGGEVMAQVLDGATLADVITANGGDVDAVTQAAVDAVTAQVNAAVAAGTLTQQQADTLLANLPDAVGRAFDGDLRGGGRGNRPGGQRQPGAAALQLANTMLDTVASQTGLTREDILTQMRDGATLADVITGAGGSVDAVKTAVTTAVTDEINQAVTDGRITQQQADALLAQLPTTLDTFLNGQLPRPTAAQRFTAGVLGLAAQQTGLTRDEISTRLRGGESLAQILTAAGVNVDTFVSDVITQVETQLAQAVASGNITQQRADDLITRLREDLPARINGTPNAAPPAP